MTDALTGRLGEILHLNTPVTSVEHILEGEFRLRFGASAPVDAAAIVLATPAATSASLLHDVAPQAGAMLAGFRATHAGAITLAVPDTAITRPLPGYGLVIPRREHRSINAVTIASRKIPGRAPAGWSLIRVFFGGARSPATMELADDALLELVSHELGDLLGLGGPPDIQRIHRWSAGSPQYDVGHLDRLAAIESALPAGIILTGSPYRGVGIPDVIRQARIAADQTASTLCRRFAMSAA
jgi:oxygen-dependent protoporphyrinogen oxidase